MSIMNRAVRITALMLLLGTAILLVGGCNTVEGVGEDVSAAGQTLADVASDTKD